MINVNGNGNENGNFNYELCTMNYIKHPYSFILNP